MGSVSYYNGEAAFLLIPFRVGIYLAGSCLVNPALRGLVLAGVLCSMEVVVLMQLRGAMVATAVSLPVFLVFLSSGQRLRSLLTLAPVVAALFIASPRLNNVYVESLTGRFPAQQSIASLSTSGRPPPRRGSTAWSGGSLIGVGDSAGSSCSFHRAYAANERVGNPVAWSEQRWEAFATND